MPVYTSRTLPKPIGVGGIHKHQGGKTVPGGGMGGKTVPIIHDLHPGYGGKAPPPSIKAARLATAKAVRKAKAVVTITMPVFTDVADETRALDMCDRFMIYSNVWNNQPRHTAEWKSAGVGYIAQREQTYGEITPEGMVRLMADLQLNEDDGFLDVGSGLGNMVMYAAYVRNVRMAYGVEIQQNRVEASHRINGELRDAAAAANLPLRTNRFETIDENGAPAVEEYTNTEFILTTDMRFSQCPRLDALMNDVNVVFCNNVLFEATTMHDLINTLVNRLACRSALIVFSVDPWPRRTKSHPAPLKYVRTVTIDNAASWASMPVNFAVYTLWDNVDLYAERRAVGNTGSGNGRASTVTHVYASKKATPDRYVRAFNTIEDACNLPHPVINPLTGFLDFEMCVEYAIKSAEARTLALLAATS